MKGKVAIVTGASKESVIGILKIHGLIDIFDLIVCQEDVKKFKPSPEDTCMLLNL